jgi:hypothetical protein
MESKTDWINKTMETLDNTDRAECDPLLLDKVLHRIHHDRPILITVRSQMVWRIAALILVLISFNVFTLVYFSKTSGNSQNTAKSVANEYFSYLGSINL